jgi:hypothetical protein
MSDPAAPVIGRRPLGSDPGNRSAGAPQRRYYQIHRETNNCSHTRETSNISLELSQAEADIGPHPTTAFRVRFPD